jgi:dTDP-4-amino-4,6-dideoxygalactose transaminase
MKTNNYRIPFNKPFLAGDELGHIAAAVQSGHLSGNGVFTKKAQHFFESRFSIPKCLLTSSCTDALEMAAILSGVGPGDEVIIPSYTFVSSANPFILRGATVVFCDSGDIHPNLDVNNLEQHITARTKAVVAVHYAGHACDMEGLLALQQRYGFMIIEDAAQAVDNYHVNGSGQKQVLGSIGAVGALSFHETKNVICGEGGALFINDVSLTARAEIIWEKGTNRSAFWRGEVDKYGWVDIGSSFLPSEVQAAFLTAQLENLERIQNKRLTILEQYTTQLASLKNLGVQLPERPAWSTENAHMFYLVLRSGDERDAFISFLKQHDIYPAFHYQSLHRSPFFAARYRGQTLPHADRYSGCLVRLPFYFSLSDDEIMYVCETVTNFFKR